MNTPITLSDLLSALPELVAQHARSSTTYALLEKAVEEALRRSHFCSTEDARETLQPFGEIELPYFKMGAVDSLDLFGLDELIIFSFYWSNKDRYQNAADIGANIGLHSILMDRCGWKVKAYEPDPTHADVLAANLRRNQSKNVDLIRAAVSDRAGTLEFVRVLGNTTSSHLAGAKSSPYGELQRFPVDVVSIDCIMSQVDFIKMDAEGQEKTIILATKADHWVGTDMIVEVGSADNARAIYDHMSKLGINAFAQRLGWDRIKCLDDMPCSYKDGSLFVSSKECMPWS